MRLIKYQIWNAEQKTVQLTENCEVIFSICTYTFTQWCIVFIPRVWLNAVLFLSLHNKQTHLQWSGMENSRQLYLNTKPMCTTAVWSCTCDQDVRASFAFLITIIQSTTAAGSHWGFWERAGHGPQTSYFCLWCADSQNPRGVRHLFFRVCSDAGFALESSESLDLTVMLMISLYKELHC